jgi:hypothetical protein
MATSYVDAHQQTWNDYPQGSVRRSRSNWLSRAGMGLLSFFASHGDDATTGVPAKPSVKSNDEAADHPVEQPIPECCSLARPDRECHYAFEKWDYQCPSGYHQQYWTCCEGTYLVGCGECTTSTSTCWQGDFECSIWWNVGGGPC